MNFKDFSKIRVLVIGDLMIDDYTFGKSNRMSPEAPVPVIIPEDRKFVAGGAGNVIENLYEMSANVSYLGAVGDDNGGKRLKLILDRKTSNNLLFENKSKTTEKKRIYLHDKQVLRIDIEEIEDLKISSNFQKFIENINQFDVVILSDYNKGILNENTLPYIINECKSPIIIDPKKSDFSMYKNATILTPNMKELNKAVEIDVKDENSITEASRYLIKNYGFKYIITTKGKDGMSVVGKNIEEHINSKFIENPDVTGAGDTVISALSLAYCNTKDIVISAKFANSAAYLAVSKKATSTNSLSEIESYINENDF
jgi:D-beta-D-heptose 7-phosphate kinase/D-beta-D-heptose 1-phosphate adenosyltransferase